MTTTDDDKKRRSAYQTGWLKINKFKERGYGVIELDDGSEIFVHISAFFGFDTNGITEGAIQRLEYRRRLHFRLAIDPRSDRLVARDVTPLREIMAPDGTIIELPLRGNKVRKQVEADRAAKPVEEARTGFAALVSELR